MNALMERLLDRPRGQKIAFWIGSLVVVTFVFWQWFYSQAADDLTKLEDAVETLQNKVAQQRRYASNLSKVKAEVKALEAKFAVALSQLPEKNKIPELLQSISGLARDAGLEVTLFQPKTENIKDFYAEIPVSMNVEGTYHQLATFFDEVSGMSRIVNINEIAVWQPSFRETKIVPQPSIDGVNRITVQASCTATTFRYLEESERVKPDSTDDKSKRKKH